MWSAKVGCEKPKLLKANSRMCFQFSKLHVNPFKLLKMICLPPFLRTHCPSLWVITLGGKKYFFLFQIMLLLGFVKGEFCIQFFN